MLHQAGRTFEIRCDTGVTKELAADGRKWWWCEVWAWASDELDVGDAELELPHGARFAVSVVQAGGSRAQLSAYGDAPTIPVG